MFKKILFGILTSSFCFANPAKSGLPRAELATMEIPPFFSSQLPEGGAASYAAKEIFRMMGYDLTLTVYPVKRGKAEALKEAQIVGFIPCSQDDVPEGFVLSNPMFRTTTLVVENSAKPVVWNTPEDLTKYRGGIGLGYSLRESMQPLHKSGKLKIEESRDDVSVLLKVAGKRLDYAFVTDQMFRYLLVKNPQVKAVAAQLQANVRTVASVDWGLCFKKNSAESRKVLELFNEKASADIFTKLVKDYMIKYSKEK